MNLDSFTGPGSTPSRRRFWDKIQQAVTAAQKKAGRNSSVDEREGEGTVINFPDQTPSTVMGACCIDGVCSVTTEADCIEAGGTYQGNGVPCDPDPCAEDCPRNDNVCIEFSAIEACGCFDVNSNHYNITDIDLNGSFTLPKSLDLPDLVQWEGFGGMVHFAKFSDVFCTDPPTEECDDTGYIVVQCRRNLDGDLVHTITYTVDIPCISGWGGTAAQIFRINDAAGPLVFGVIENTETGCGPTGTGTGIAENGVVTVASGEC